MDKALKINYNLKKEKKNLSEESKRKNGQSKKSQILQILSNQGQKVIYTVHNVLVFRGI